jgi:hypothetical protein
MSKLSWRPKLTNGSGMLRNTITAVITASLISISGAFVALKVQERDININTSDVQALEHETREQQINSAAINTRVAKLETQVQGNERVHDNRYNSIDRRLKALQNDMNILMRRGGHRRVDNE